MEIKRPTKATEPAPLSSPAHDIRKVRSSAGATVDEIREFLAQMRGKSPKEMLGIVASSNLVRSTATAAVGVAAMIVVFTIIPFAWGAIFSKDGGKKKDESAEVAVVESKPEKETEAEEEPSGPVRDAGTADALGIGETKTAPSGVNPLDAATDDLLKDLE